MMMMVMAADCLGKILDVGELPALRGVGEVSGKLVELARRRRVAGRRRSLGGVLQIDSDLLGDLLVLGRVRLLQLLERAQHLRKGGKLVAVWLQRNRRRVYAAQTMVGRAGFQAAALDGAAENRL